jgi:hypothetical protein
LEIGSRSERNVARVARNVATIDKRGARHVGMSDERRAPTAIRIETTAGPYVLRFVRRFATRRATQCLKSGSRQETRAARHVGTSGESRSATVIRIETTAGRCGCKRPAETWRAVVDQRELPIAFRPKIREAGDTLRAAVRGELESIVAVLRD